MADIILAEWRNANEHVNFPFSDVATLVNRDGVAIDRDVFDDARLYPLSGTENLYLSSVEVSADLPPVVTIYFGIQSNPKMAHAAYDPSIVDDELAVVDSAGRASGILVSSAAKLQAFARAMPVGVTEFTPAETPFAPTVLVPMPGYGVRSIVLDDGQAVSGDVFVVGTDGMVIWEQDGYIRVDAVGSPYALVRKCVEEGLEPPVTCPLRTINGVGPDERGNFVLLPGRNEAYDNVFRVLQNGAAIEVRAEGLMGLTDV